MVPSRARFIFDIEESLLGCFVGVLNLKIWKIWFESLHVWSSREHRIVDCLDRTSVLISDGHVMDFGVAWNHSDGGDDDLFRLGAPVLPGFWLDGRNWWITHQVQVKMKIKKKIRSLIWFDLIFLRGIEDSKWEIYGRFQRHRVEPFEPFDPFELFGPLYCAHKKSIRKVPELFYAILP